MVFKRYIKKGGKKLGPYYYQNIRDKEGRIRSVYIGADRKHRKKRFANAIIILSVILLIALFGFYYMFYDRAVASIPVLVIEKKPELFDVDQIIVRVSLKEEEFLARQIKITNTADRALDFSINTGALSELVDIKEKEFNLKQGQAKTVVLNFTTSQKERNLVFTPGVYTGKLVVRAANDERVLPVIVEIESKRVLFDMNLLSLSADKIVKKGEEINFEIRIFNLEGVQQGTVDMTYLLKNVDGNTIVTQSESVTVKNQASFSKTIQIPKNVNPGNYVFAAIAQHGSSVGTTTYLFDIIEEPQKIEAKAEEISIFNVCKRDMYCWGLLFFIALILVLIAIFAYFAIGTWVFFKLSIVIRDKIKNWKKQARLREKESLKQKLEKKRLRQEEEREKQKEPQREKERQEKIKREEELEKQREFEAKKIEEEKRRKQLEEEKARQEKIRQLEEQRRKEQQLYEEKRQKALELEKKRKQEESKKLKQIQEIKEEIANQIVEKNNLVAEKEKLLRSIEEAKNKKAEIEKGWNDKIRDLEQAAQRINEYEQRVLRIKNEHEAKIKSLEEERQKFIDKLKEQKNAFDKEMMEYEQKELAEMQKRAEVLSKKEKAVFEKLKGLEIKSGIGLKLKELKKKQAEGLEKLQVMYNEQREKEKKKAQEEVQAIEKQLNIAEIKQHISSVKELEKQKKEALGKFEPSIANAQKKIQEIEQGIKRIEDLLAEKEKQKAQLNSELRKLRPGIVSRLMEVFRKRAAEKEKEKLIAIKAEEHELEKREKIEQQRELLYGKVNDFKKVLEEANKYVRNGDKDNALIKYAELKRIYDNIAHSEGLTVDAKKFLYEKITDAYQRIKEMHSEEK